MNRRDCNQRGITLVGILVLVVIVVVAFFLLRPMFLRAWQQSYQAACVNNLRKIGQALQQYTSEFGEIVPPAQWCWGSAPGDISPWTQTLAAFIPERDRKDVFKCPAKKTAQIGYAVNYFTFRNNVDPKATKQNFATVGMIRSPGETIYALDAGKVTEETKNLDPLLWKEEPGDAPSLCRCTKSDPFWDKSPIRPIPRHQGRVNCLMLDGGVKDYSVEDIVTPKEKSKSCLWDAY